MEIDFITQKEFIALLLEHFPDEDMPIVAFNVKGHTGISTRQFNQVWSHRWNTKVIKENLVHFTDNP